MRSGWLGFQEILSLAVLLPLRNLRRNLKRNLATGSTIALGLAGILMMGGYYYRAAQWLRIYTVVIGHTGHLVVYSANGFEQFDLAPRESGIGRSEQDKIENVLRGDSRIDFFEKQLWGYGLLGNGCTSVPVSLKGYEPSIDQRLSVHAEVKKWMPEHRSILKGEGLWQEPREDQIMLTPALARTLGKLRVKSEFPAGTLVPVNCMDADARSKVGEDANVQLVAGTWSGNMNALDAEIVGQFSTGVDESDRDAAIVPVSLLQRLLDTESVARYAIWLKDERELPGFMNELRGKLNQAQVEAQVRRWDDEDLSPYYSGTVKFLVAMLTFVSGILGVVVVLSVFNSMTITILERSHEIGVYRALGFRRAQVNALLVLEALWLALLALVAGGVFGFAVIEVINRAKFVYYPPGVSDGLELSLFVPPGFSLEIGAVLIVLSVLVTWFSARQRLTKDITLLLGGPAR